MQEWFEKRRNSIDTSVVFGRANTPISLAPRALSMRQRRVHFAFGVHSAPRSQDNAGSIANSDNQHRLEYALIISGEGMKHMNKTFITRIVSSPCSLKTFCNIFSQIQQKYPAITDFHWSHQRSLEMTSIRRKFHIHGTFVKILFANQRERLRAHTFVKPFILGGKMVKINEYTSRKPTPAAPSSSPASKFILPSGNQGSLTMQFSYCHRSLRIDGDDVYRPIIYPSAKLRCGYGGGKSCY